MPPGHETPSSFFGGLPPCGSSDGSKSHSTSRRSKILNMPMPPSGSPPVDEDLVDGKRRGGRKKPKVIGKPPPTKMSEDGSDWGERCIDIYEIVGKVGEGTYGEVFKSVFKNSMETDTQEQFALKKVRTMNVLYQLFTCFLTSKLSFRFV